MGQALVQKFRIITCKQIPGHDRIIIFVIVSKTIQIISMVLIFAGVEQVSHQSCVDYSVMLYIQVSELVKLSYALESVYCHTEILAGVQVLPRVRLSIVEVNTPCSLPGCNSR